MAELLKKAQIGLNFFKQYLKDWFKINLQKKTDLDPIFALYLITKKCNFRCEYCYAESNERINSVAPTELDTEKTKELLKIMRKDVPAIYFSGGEPLLRKDITEIVKYSKYDLKYTMMSLTTNGLLLPKYQEILAPLDYLAISLDTLDMKKNDKLSGVKDGTSEKVLQIIKDTAKLQKEKKFSLLISSVVTPENIKDQYDLMDFCFKNNIGYSIIGQMKDLQPNEEIRNNPEWYKLVDDVVKYNKMGYPVLGIPDFNEIMLKFQKHKCYPTLIPTVYPNGDLLYPCEVLNKKRYNLLEIGSIKKANQLGKKEVGFNPNCPGECYLPCYISASLFMTKPFTAIKGAINLSRGNCYNIKENEKVSTGNKVK